MTFIQSWLTLCIIKDRRARKRLVVGLYSLGEGWDFIYISDTGYSTTFYKISSKSHSCELDINAILSQATLICFILTGLSSGLPGDDRFYDMINYVSVSLVILEIVIVDQLVNY